MKLINKQKQPKEWKAKVETPGASYSAIPELKASLLIEQGYVCCYCMSRIELDTMKVEHYKSFSKHEDKRMEYDNLMAVCLGKTCSIEHCDTSRGNSDLTIDPTDNRNNVNQLISYKPSDCHIVCDAKFENDINVILNLNAPILKENRLRVKKKVFLALDALHKKNANNWSTTNIQKILKFWIQKENDKYQPYCQMIIYFLEKRLNSLT